MKLRIFRWLLAIGAWIFCAFEFKAVLASGGGITGVPALLFGFGSFIAGLLLVSPEIIVPVSGFFADLFIDVIYPGSRASKPALSYLLARRYHDQARLEESIAEYQKILHYYPKEKDAYRELLLVAQEAGDERTFRKYTRRYLRHFREPFRLDTPPSSPRIHHD
jgi:tetratricopeptide (TPR) repeat protein